MNNNMGQQKIYVDIEEEITTVIEQLRHARSGDVVLVVPQHAMLLQSVVNLKLLAQEARKLQKNISIMTKDVDGAAFAERAGISAQSYVADEESQVVENKIVERDYQAQSQQNSQQKTQRHIGVAVGMDGMQRSGDQNLQSREQVDQKNNGIVVKNGSAGSDIAASQYKNIAPQKTIKAESGTKNVREPHVDQGIDQYEKSLEEMRVQSTQSQDPYQPEQRRVGTTIHPTQQKDSFIPHQTNQKRTSQRRSTQSRVAQKKKRKKKKESQVSGRAHFMLKSFVYIGIALITLVLCVVILPKTHISVTPKNVQVNENMEMTARTDQSVYDEDRRLIPARLVERDVTFTKTFSSTGSGDVDAQKAQGTIMIYNEYSEKPQPLVATTRFLSEDGVLFRLAKQTTVPGMKDGEPGKVEALVVADEEGDDGNIGPARFSIPGFDSSPKEGKFYGVSEKAMTGGGAGGKGVALVTQEDIDNAEREMNAEVDVYVEGQMRAVLRPDSEVLLAEAMENEILRSESSVTAGTMGEDFMYEIVSHVKAIVFAQGDVLAVMQSGVDEEMGQYDVDQVDMLLSYDVVEVDFDNEQLKMKVQGSADIVTVVDLESFKKDILGKKHDELLGVIEDDHGNEVEKITIESVVPGFPAFIANRISRLGFMTDLRIMEDVVE